MKEHDLSREEFCEKYGIIDDGDVVDEDELIPCDTEFVPTQIEDVINYYNNKKCSQ